MSRTKGDAAETRAAEHLRALGFELVDRNVYSRFGEIDIIAMHEGTLHFVEVKSAPELEQALANVTPKKLARVIKTAQAYMKKKGLEMPWCVDAVAVAPGQIELIENITI